ncbi:hypothetical protein Metbo_1581 [Methanobacterium lacus]|uniref:Uncharacterized protein n=1 Tax=Methanobacterium lacus (strain AL-21) TaxID=877455 RepID=F0T8Y0_METLA|nr:hypothetical protein Metbo_1581 [Methanobacterium lacus]
MFIVVVTVQPLFGASESSHPTKITGADGKSLKDITVSAGSPIELQARLYWYFLPFTTDTFTWIPQTCRYLEFYIYKVNPDGTNGDLAWNDTAMTNFFTGNANPDEFKLTENGTYSLVVKYDGKLRHCNATAKIFVESQNNYKLWDKRITGPDREPLKDIHVRDGDLTQLQARISVYDHLCNENTSINKCWVDKIGLYLHFYIYKTNPDGSSGDLVWDDTAMTNLATFNANPDKFSLSEADTYNGTYNLVVKYEGDIARPCNATAKIFVEPRKNAVLGDTKIAGKYGCPLRDITVHSGSPIKLQARLYLYEDGMSMDWYNKPAWRPIPWYYLDFFVYKSNLDGTNGGLVWNDSAMTNYFTYNSNPDEFTLTEKGCYNLVVKYDGKMNHCRSDTKIFVV